MGDRHSNTRALIDFESEPFQRFLPHAVAMSDAMREVCEVEIASLLLKGAICKQRWVRAVSYVPFFVFLRRMTHGSQ